MAAAPPVSVLFPARNAAATVDDALGSVLEQTDPDFEVIAVDDASSDDTLDRLRAWAARDRRVRVLARNGARGDLVAALERARAAARGAYLLRMDADDFAHPERLAACRPLLDADPALAAVSCLVRSFPGARVRPGRRRYDAWLNGLRTHEAMARERFVESPVAHPSVLLRACAVAAVGGYRRFAGPEDYDLWLRLFAAGARFAKVPRLLLFWREREGRLSRRCPRYGPAGFARARADAFARLLAGRPAALLGSGSAGRRMARELLARGVRVSFFVDRDPRKVGRSPYGVPVLGFEEALARRRGEVVLTAVNAWGARAAARRGLREAGLREGRDFFLGS